MVVNSMNKTKKIILICAISLVAVIALVIFLFFFSLRAVADSEEVVDFVVISGEGKEEIVDNLKDAGLVRSKYATLIYIVLSGNTNIQAGNYEFNRGMSTQDIVASLASGDIIDSKRVFFESTHIIKWKVNLQEYFDLNKRYSSLTDIIKFEDDKIELEMLPKYYFKHINDDLLQEPIITDKEEYNKLLYSYIPIDKISDKYTTNIEKVIDTINNELNTHLSISNINNYLEVERLKEFNKLIDEKFDDNTLMTLLNYIKTRNDNEVISYVTDNADVPTIFEYIIGIIWYKVSGRIGNILKFMNLSLDANLLPKTHAGGGMADIVYGYENTNSYPKHNLLIEATISESTGQRHMEMEPVSRHLGEDINKTSNEKDYALFIATNLEERVILDFRNMRTRFYPKTDGSYINGLKIIPIDSDILINIIKDKLNYNELYMMFDNAYNSIVPDPEWYNKEILEKS